MLIIPAIYLQEGKCVCLKQGQMDDSSVVSSDPIDTAGRWFDLGVRRLQIVDVDGARAGFPVNSESILQIAQRFPNLPLQVGGGLRHLDSVERYLKAGVNDVILATSAIKEPELLVEACEAFPDRIITGIDAKDGVVAIDGWKTLSDMSVLDLVRSIDAEAVSAIVHTDIGRSGLMQGVNIETTLRLAQATSAPVIASGGVANMKDIRALKALSYEGIGGVVVGRALYDGALDLVEAQIHCDQ